MINITKAILNVIESIQPFDDLEALHVQDASNWIRTTTDSIFRISKPDKPPKHLVSYFVVVDEARHTRYSLSTTLNLGSGCQQGGMSRLTRVQR